LKQETMMRLATLAFLVPAILAVPACNKSPSVDIKNATPAEVANAVRESGASRALVRPGKWASTVAIVDIDAPGMPPEVIAKMTESIGKERTGESCLTADQVDHPERMLHQIPQSCRYDHYLMADGKIDGKLRCDTEGVIREMSLVGTYSTDKYEITVDNRASAPPGSGDAAMAMKMHIESHRIGDCDAKQPG
jgi:hypothetical protein